MHFGKGVRTLKKKSFRLYSARKQLTPYWIKTLPPGASSVVTHCGLHLQVRWAGYTKSLSSSPTFFPTHPAHACEPHGFILLPHENSEHRWAQGQAHSNIWMLPCCLWPLALLPPCLFHPPWPSFPSSDISYSCIPWGLCTAVSCPSIIQLTPFNLSLSITSSEKPSLFV